MYTLLIADDEPLAQVGLKSMIDWAALDISVVESSPNGAHALEAIQRIRPDIVIVDVRMPIIDGITLIERCCANMQDPPEFIVLSGYADFDYARRAMRSGVADYLVKLELTEESLKTSVEKALTAAKAKRVNTKTLGEDGIADPFAETALSRLLFGACESEGSAHRALVESGAQGDADDVFKCAAAFSVCYPHGERLSEEERLRSYRCVLDTIKQVSGREARVLIAPFDTSSFAAVLCFPVRGKTEEAIAASAAATIARSRDSAEKFFGVELRVGIGSADRAAARIAESYKQAKKALSETKKDRPIVGYDELPGDQMTLETPIDPEIRVELVRALDAGSPERFREAIDAMLAGLNRAEASASETLALCCGVLYPVIDRLDDAATILNSLFPNEKDGYRCLFTAASRERMRAWLVTLRDGLAARFESKRARGRNPLVAGVRAYVLEHWSEKLALADVASHFRVSPNHLSSIFKKYNGSGFAEFVNEVKVEKAKELIVEGKYKMYEVAQLLGFEDAYYFSKVFKKVSGLSPREYYLRFAIPTGY